MERALSSAQFETLLQRLGPDREVAGARYEQLRRRLLAVFAYRGCRDPDTLADETLDRVARKLLEMGPAFHGDDPSAFVFGVAWRVAMESFKRPATVPLPEGWDMADPRVSRDTEDERSAAHDCLERCLRRLPAGERDMVLRYYRDEKRSRIRQRSALARDLKVSANALRIRIHRITAHLRECALRCVETRSKLRLVGWRQADATPGE